MFNKKNIVSLFAFIVMTFSGEYAFSKNDLPKNISGSCEPLDLYLNECKPFNCSMNLPTPSGYGVTMQMTVQGMYEGKCYYRTFLQILSEQMMVPFKIIINCTLSEDGRKAVIEEFQDFKNGNHRIYDRSSKNPIIKRECSPQE